MQRLLEVRYREYIIALFVSTVVRLSIVFLVAIVVRTYASRPLPLMYTLGSFIYLFFELTFVTTQWRIANVLIHQERERYQTRIEPVTRRERKFALEDEPKQSVERQE
jgi:hypothetical protein